MALTCNRYLSADYERKVFNVSACAWNEGATENIVTITSTDSNATTGGGSSSSSGSHLKGGALAGVIVGCVVAGALIAAAVAFVVLRKRRQWIKKGFSVAGIKPEPDEAVLKGPVFNSDHQPTDVHSTPVSAAAVSAPTSSMRQSATTSDSPAGLPEGLVADASGSQLDSHGTLIGSRTELDGTELQRTNTNKTSPVAKNPGVYELPGSQVGVGRFREVLEPSSATSSSPLDNKSELTRDSPSSPLVSTLGSTWGRDERADAGIVSPVSPVRE